MNKLKLTIDKLIETYEINDIEMLAHSIGIYVSERVNEVTEKRKQYTLQVIYEHMEELEKDDSDFEFHLASIWKLYNDIN